MLEQIATTPFGGGAFGAAHFLRQTRARQQQEKLCAGEGGNETAVADKWQLVRSLTEARAVYGLSDRSIALLDALLSFHQERQLDGSKPVIVFPSNEELSLRCRGMSEATLRRHLAALVEAGLIFRRDSANGKRFCRRNGHGAVEDAFGFDLAPLALRASEIYAHAEAAREEARQIDRLRREISLHLRDMSRIVDAAIEEGRSGDWETWMMRVAANAARLPRNATKSGLETRCETVAEMRSELESAYLNSINLQEMSGNDLDFERHIQNSNTESTIEYGGNEKITAAGANNLAGISGFRLDHILKTCPDITDYARNGIKTWDNLFEAAGIVRATLGISPSAWEEACVTLGKVQASIVIAVMLKKADAIRSAGGYLRQLTRKAREGQFTVHAMLRALERPGTTS